MNSYAIFDIETDGLIENVTKIHCLSYLKYNNGNISRGSITDYKDIKVFLEGQDILIGHNIIRYDIPILKKLLPDVSISAKLYDSLGLSWYLFPNRIKHGLEYWGEELGVEKPKIQDWSNQSIKDYIHRCESDVEINSRLWNKEWQYLIDLYGNEESVLRLLGYITFKLDCAREQEEIKWKLDVGLCARTLAELCTIRDQKQDILSASMPEHVVYKNINKPKEVYKKDGSLSVRGKKWLELLEELQLPEYYSNSVEIESGRESGNPKSIDQMKSWLYSLGWEPCTYSYVKNKATGQQRKIPQVYNDKGVTPSVKLLFEKEPALENLEGLTIVNHRIGILEGFLKNRDKDNFLKAEIKGFTNTMRFQHTTIVNLPTIHKPYGEQIRGCLIAPGKEYLLCGSDMSSLEDNTKQHYMFFYDPDYVREMRVPGFDPHLDIALLAGMLTQEEVDFFKWYNKTKEENPNYVFTEEEKSKFKHISDVRKQAKVVNFSAVYGVGADKMHLSSGMPRQKCVELLETYWERNKAVKTISKNSTHKTVNGQMWLWNPVSQMWYSLRYEKDTFSTLNQGKSFALYKFA